MGCYIGAKDKIDRALVKQYASVQTCKFDNEKIKPDEMLKMIDLLSLQAKNFHFKKVS